MSAVKLPAGMISLLSFMQQQTLRSQHFYSSKEAQHEPGQRWDLSLFGQMTGLNRDPLQLVAGCHWAALSSAKTHPASSSA